MSYCTYCGAEQVKEWTGMYDKDTGEKRMREVCPRKPCEHSCHDFRWIENQSIWRRAFGLWIKCRRCGAT